MRKIAFVMAALTFASTAHAAQIGKFFAVGNWAVGAYTNDQTGDFSHCAASVTYNSGITAFFSINRNYTWSMAFGDPSWSLQAGAAYPIAFSIDNIPALNATARALQSNLAEVPSLEAQAYLRHFVGVAL
jgi:hypothetical protein